MNNLGETILIERGELLNFWHAPTQFVHPHVPGRVLNYSTNEHRFQAMKTIALRADFEGEVAKLHDAIAAAKSPSVAKMMGRDLPIDVAKWDAASYREMLKANTAKFSQHPDLLGKLLDTGLARIVEHRPDPTWGDNMDGSGKNLQGVVLMNVRASLRPLFLNATQHRMIGEILIDQGIIDEVDWRGVEHFIRQAETALIIHGTDSAAAREILRIAELLPTSD